LTIERDAINNNIYYLSFLYDALLNFDINIYFNCQKKFENDLKNFNHTNSIISGLNFGIFVPSDFFKNRVISKKNIPIGQEMKFFDKNIFLDWNLFSHNKTQEENSIDIVIEMIPLIENNKQNTNSNKMAFYTLCKFSEDNGYCLLFF